MKVVGANLANGMLTVSLERQVPEESKPRKVEIKRGSGESGQLIIKFGNFDQLDYIRMRLTGGHG